MIDAHLDLAMNAMEWNRDLTRGIDEIRGLESGMKDRPDRGRNTVCFPEMRRAGIRLVVATQIAKVKYNIPGLILATWNSPAQAWAATQAQLAWYRTMEEAGELQPIRNQRELTAHFAGAGNTIGYMLSLEGADSLVTLDHLQRAYDYGLRAIGPAHFGPGVYAQGTGATGGFPPAGRDLLRAMDELGMILDVTHLSDECFDEALELYRGPIWASHHNCRALVPNQRQLSDDQIRRLVERDAVIGLALDGFMTLPNWVRGETTPQSSNYKLEDLFKHIYYICQIAGNSRHVGLGSDLDGGFGRERTPQDLKTIADVRKIGDILVQRGFSEEDRANFNEGNFLRFLQRALPE